MEITPIGRVHSTRSEPLDDDWDSVISTVEFDADVLRPDALAGLEQFSHVEIVYLLDRVDPHRVETGSRHPRNNPDWPAVGILAQRASRRPNRLGLCRCRLVSVDGLTIEVRDLDAIDGTPVLDVKPWMVEFGPRGPVGQPVWASELMAGYWSTDAGSFPSPDETRQSYDRVAGHYADELAGELASKVLDRALLGALCELAGAGPCIDAGSGPGQAAAFLAALGSPVVACDLSPAMSRIALEGAGIPAAAGDLRSLPFRSGVAAAVVSLYAVIHLDRAGRTEAYRELARVLEPGGHALLAFHTDDDQVAAGGAVRRREWWGEEVDITFRFLDPDQEAAALAAAGLELVGRLDRAPVAGVEHPSRRTYLLVRRGTA